MAFLYGYQGAQVVNSDCCTYVVQGNKKGARFASNSLIFSVAGAGLEPATFGL